MLADAGSETTEPPLRNAGRPQVTPTYDGSGVVVHPDILRFPGGWCGWEYWLALTPYPGDDTSKENPSILVSHDGDTWREPPGIANPIVLPQVSYLADPDLLYDAVSDQLWVYYVHQKVSRRTHLMRRVSSDGVCWGPQTEDLSESLFDVPDYELLSPAVLKVGERYRMWSVNTGSVGCHAPATRIQYRTSADGLDWSAPANVDFVQEGYDAWHLDVIYAPGRDEFMALVSAWPKGGSCHDTMLFFANSSDGVRWQTYPRPALLPAARPAWDCNQIYRSTLLYDPAQDRLRVWYSADDGVSWRLGYTERNYTQFLTLLAR